MRTQGDEKYFNGTWEFGTAKLVNKYNKWFLHIPMTKEYQALDFAHVNHQITKALVDKYLRGTMFVLEDLTGVHSATEKVRVKNRYISVSWAFYQFRQMLEYKAKMNGQKVITVDPKYTSQTCPKCGQMERANRNKKLHTFKCKNCQYQSNDDRIGAMNLHHKGIEHIGVVTTGV